jgi:hypothetical protein
VVVIVTSPIFSGEPALRRHRGGGAVKPRTTDTVNASCDRRIEIAIHEVEVLGVTDTAVP